MTDESKAALDLVCATRDRLETDNARLHAENAELRAALLEVRMNLHAVRIAGDNIPTPERYSFTNSADAEEVEGVIRYVQGIVETYGIEVNDG